MIFDLDEDETKQFHRDLRSIIHAMFNKAEGLYKRRLARNDLDNSDIEWLHDTRNLCKNFPAKPEDLRPSDLLPLIKIKRTRDWLLEQLIEYDEKIQLALLKHGGLLAYEKLYKPTDLVTLTVVL